MSQTCRGVDPATGRRRQKSKGGFPTKKAAEEAMRDAIARGTGGTGAGVRLGDYLDEWLEAATPRLRETTAGGYARAVTDIKEGLGAVRLRDLTPLMIERFYAELSRTGGRARACRPSRSGTTTSPSARPWPTPSASR